MMYATLQQATELRETLADVARVRHGHRVARRRWGRPRGGHERPAEFQSAAPAGTGAAAALAVVSEQAVAAAESRSRRELLGAVFTPGADEAGLRRRARASRVDLEARNGSGDIIMN